MLSLKSSFKLKKPPTDICFIFDKIFISSKSKFLFYFDQKLNKINMKYSILSLINFNDFLLCGNNNLSVLDNKLNIINNKNLINTTIIKFFINNDNIIIGNKNKKIEILDKSLKLIKTFYCLENNLIDFDYFNNKILVISENLLKVKLINLENEEKTINLQSFPFSVQFINEEKFLIGFKDKLELYEKNKIKQKKEIKGKGIKIFKYSSEIFLIGTDEGKIYLLEIKEEIKIIKEINIKGIPIGFALNGGKVAIAISKESRIGRYKRVEGENSVIILE